ncbi:MAG: YraN family protein [Oscillospiraceae bacterium]|nr:YraN family protein [Oscillospiraceae bacterium]MBQ9929957.1 YraN family protein [Oscillospiraceae bacterium]
MATSKLVGAWGEALAAQYLQKKRYKLVACGYQCRFGEIDLIVKNRKYLVFVEVKLRKTAKFASGREFVDYRKQDRLRATASMYLALNPTRLQPRFDVIEIYAPEGTLTLNPELTHLEDAFQ